MLPFEIWSANILYDDKTNKKERPIIILGLLGDRVICLKCTTNITTNIPHQTINWKKYHLLKPTVIEFKRKYFIKKSNLKYKLSSLDGLDTLNIISGLRLNNLKDFYLEKLNESWQTGFEYGYAGYILRNGDIITLDDVPYNDQGDMRLAQHGEGDQDLPKEDQTLEISNSHNEDDTCVRLYNIPTNKQYKSLELVIDKYLDKEGYCKVEFFGSLKHKYAIFANDTLEYSSFPYSAEEVGFADKVYEGSRWNGYTIVRWIKQNINKEELNESFSDKYDFATHYQRHVQLNDLNKDNVKNQFSFMPPEKYEKIAIELMNSPAGPSKSLEHDVVGFKVDQGRYLKFDKRYNTLIVYNPEEKEILTCYKINYNKYLSRLDRDFKGELPENEDKENTINMIEIVEAKKSKKKRKNQTQNTPIFKDVNDIMKWVRKRLKGLSPFSYLNPNAGNVEYNTDMFNHMTGADGGDFGSLSGSGNQLGAPAIGSDMGSFGGDAGGGISSGGGMGESFDTSKNKLEISPKVQKFISKYKELIDDEDWDNLFLKYAEKELNIDEQSNLVEILQSIGCDFEIME